ncbi:MAG: hypothetical protein ACP5VR_04730 [Acidimicrobiales bacterium]
MLIRDSRGVSRSSRRKRSRNDERGIALILVIAAMTALLLGALAAVQYAVGYLPLARADQDRIAALAAAEAGVNDYLNRLNQDPNYWGDGSTNLAMQTTPSWGWVPVAPGSDAYFHYSVDASDITNYKENNSPTGSWGTLYVTSTGRVRNVTRTIQVGLRQATFLDHLYLSMYNLVDPTLGQNVSGMTPQQAMKYCVYYAYQENPNTGEPGPDLQLPGCQSLINYWVAGNVVNGPMLSDDDYYIDSSGGTGPTFDDTVQTADPNPGDAPYYKDPANPGGANPIFEKGPITGGVPSVVFPSSIFSYIGQDVAAPGSSPNPDLGCEYYGPTSITFNGDKMQVYSPDTPAGEANTGCLGTDPSQWLSLPANGVIYVANAPADDTCNVPTPGWAQFAETGCMGEAFVEGTVDGQVTVAADDNIYLMAPQGSSSTTIGAASFSGGDVMGLAAGNFVLVNHDTTPGAIADSFGPETYATTVKQVTLNAAVFTLQGSLGTDNYWNGLGHGDDVLTINGAIVSKFMDIEGEFSVGGGLTAGYNEVYNWDSRLAHLTPPYFIPSTDSQWVEVSYAELPAENG